MTREDLIEGLWAARRATESLCLPLAVEDHVVQPEESVSPPKWHLAHTTWFFENFLLGKYQAGYRPKDPAYAFLFNSYYESAGGRAEKGKRGCYSRPSVEDVYRYRRDVDADVAALLASPAGSNPDLAGLVELGIHHEQQHQELLATDIKRILHFNPSRPAYAGSGPHGGPSGSVSSRWVGIPEGLRDIGWSGDAFSFDNERPRHKVWVGAFRIQDGLVSNGRYLEFIRDGGYSRADLWLSEGWRVLHQEGWTAPMYWERSGGGGDGWSEYTLAGMRALDPDAPVCHVSFFEADAFARWSGARLPTEAEWETACLNGAPDLRGMLGGLWQWTASAYLAYPGFKAFPGAVGEYNGKFMMDQMVLRGGSWASPAGHVRPTYRNFFPAATRWQFSGIRLAEDA
jgi:ergothioneine biosynthesis protein EgtB